MKGVRFHDSKLKLVEALLFRSFHETEAPTAGFVHRLFLEGRILNSYPWTRLSLKIIGAINWQFFPHGDTCF